MNMYDARFEELKSIRNSKGTYEVGLADAIGFVKDKGGNVAYGACNRFCVTAIS